MENIEKKRPSFTLFPSNRLLGCWSLLKPRISFTETRVEAGNWEEELVMRRSPRNVWVLLNRRTRAVSPCTFQTAANPPRAQGHLSSGSHGQSQSFPLGQWEGAKVCDNHHFQSHPSKLAPKSSTRPQKTDHKAHQMLELRSASKIIQSGDLILQMGTDSETTCPNLVTKFGTGNKAGGKTGSPVSRAGCFYPRLTLFENKQNNCWVFQY